ncbi:MAG: hypothetical protein JNJ77_17815 [Planctomycetia bacterium]|nr:hypothetical protein [Planctomycetia bacterium]
MIFTLRANRQTTASRQLTLLSVATSLLLVCSQTVLAQEPVQPPKPLPAVLKQDTPPQIKPLTPQEERAVQLEMEEGQFTPPTRDQLYRMDSEAAKLERLKQLRKAMNRTDLDYPDEDAIRIMTKLETRKFEEMKAMVQASYVVYQPLYFQQINVERYGWECGVFQPVISTAQFYGDVLLFPYKFASNPPWHCEANAGYALPGDPEPLRFLTTPFSWRGVAAQAGVAVGAAGIFP